MNASIRDQLARVLGDLGNLYPHWRFGQLVANVAGMADVALPEGEDDQLLEAASRHAERRFRVLQISPRDLAEKASLPSPRREILLALDRLRKAFPDWPLGRLVAQGAEWAGVNVWDVEDEPLLEALKGRLQVVENY